VDRCWQNPYCAFSRPAGHRSCASRGTGRTSPMRRSRAELRPWRWGPHHVPA
jgi:hypothetical protein